MKVVKITLFLLLASFCFASASDIEKVFARATKFHKNDRNCDPWTARGQTCTKIKLRENCDDTIGMVAVDPNKIPYGSLIYSPQNKRFYLACNRGGAVSDRTAAKELAEKKGLSKKHRDALVLDFYAPREIIDNHFDYFYVVEHEGENFRFEMTRAQQYERLKPEFWLKKIEDVAKIEKEFKEEAKEMIARLREMS